MSAMYVRRDLIKLENLRHTCEPILVKSLMYVMCATKDSLPPQACQNIVASILVKKHMSVMLVRRDLIQLDTFRNT